LELGSGLLGIKIGFYLWIIFVSHVGYVNYVGQQYKMSSSNLLGKWNMCLSLWILCKELRTSYKVWRWNILNWGLVCYSVNIWFYNLQGKLSVSSRADSSGSCTCPADGIFLWWFAKSMHWIWSQRGWIWEVCWHFWLWNTLNAWGWWVIT